MSTTLTIGISAWPILAAKPDQAFVQPAELSTRWGQGDIAMQVALAKIPRTATIVKAEFLFAQAYDQPGVITVRAYHQAGPWPASIRWNNRPPLEPGFTSQTRQGPGRGTWWAIPVTQTVQRIVSGEVPNRGFRVMHESNLSWLTFRGPRAVAQQPRAVITYTVVPPAPTNLQPSDAEITPEKPVLLFDGDSGLIGLHVQIDPNASASSPAWDSGPVVATGGMLNLAETGYPGLAIDASTWWRARQQTDGGWSPWSGWARFTRIGQSALAITHPTGSPDPNGDIPIADGTPPITWTLSRPQVAWRARMLQANGDPLADSGRTVGDLQNWTPDRGLTTDGQRGLIEVQAWDDQDRTAVPDAPVQAIQTMHVVLAVDATIEPFTDVVAADSHAEPVVTVSGLRSSIPDAVAVIRDGAEVARIPGGDACVPASGGGFLCTGRDHTATMNRPQRFQLAPIVNTNRGPGGDPILLTPHTTGIWLTSVDHPTERVVIVTGDDQTQEQPETAIVHVPFGDGLIQWPIRRRLQRSAPLGSLAGDLIDVPSRGWDALEMEATLRTWAEERDAGARYWLILGGYTGRVIIGDVTFSELNTHPSEGRWLSVALNWWEAEGPPPRSVTI